MNEEKVPYESTRPPQLIEKLKQEELSPSKKLNWKEIAKEILILLFVIFGVVMPFRMYVATLS